MTTFDKSNLSAALAAHLNLSTQRKKRYEPALALFDTETSNGVPQRKATEHAITLAFKGLTSEKAKKDAQQARKDAGLTASARAQSLTAAITKPLLKRTSRKEREVKKVTKVTVEKPRGWGTIIAGFLLGAFFGLLIGAAILVVTIIVIGFFKAGWYESGTPEVLTTIILIAGTIIGALIGVWVATHILLNPSSKEKEVTETHEAIKKLGFVPPKSTTKTA